MSSERDIDDILNSLNQLLREGESHNDDHHESDAGQTRVEAVEAVEAVAEPAAVSPEIQPQVEDVTEEADAASPAWDEADDDEEAVEPQSLDDSPVSTHRVVLTEDMMVDNPQGSLLSLIKQAAAGQQPGSPKGSDAPNPQGAGRLHVDHDHMAQLINRISDDLIERLRQELPSLIADSLYRHLKELQRDE